MCESTAGQSHDDWKEVFSWMIGVVNNIQPHLNPILNQQNRSSEGPTLKQKEFLSHSKWNELASDAEKCTGIGVICPQPHLVDKPHEGYFGVRVPTFRPCIGERN